MIHKENNFAYIDGANLYKGIAELGWRLNYKKFRVWLSVLVTGDGDFACLVHFLKERNRFKVVLSPNSKKASVLLKKAVPENIVFLERFRNRLEYEKTPLRDETRMGAFS